MALVAGLLIFAFSACLLAFQLALGSHFRCSGGLARPMRALVALSAGVWGAATFLLASRSVPAPSLLVPAVVLLVSAGILFAVTRLTTPPRVLPAAFAGEAPAFVIQDGPYRFIRHPFYTAYILYWVGLGFAAPHPAVLIGVVLIVSAYVLLARREERALLQGPLGDAYQRYLRSTGRFLPRIQSRRS